MKKDAAKPAKTPKTTETQLLNLLKKVLPKATHDAGLASKIYSAIESELKTAERAKAFEKFCNRVELPNLEPKTVISVQKQFQESFNDGEVAVKANKKTDSLAVEINLKDGTQFISEIKVREVPPEQSDEQEITLKFISFPVCLPGDKELIWALAKRENMTSEEAGIALAKAEEEFWASKTGQKLIRDRVEKCFPEFISRVPSGMLTELGLKRHYKTPEALKVMRSIKTK